MSYCRWSSLNWRCNVYVYADVGGGWTTHVAGRRRAMPPVPDILGGRMSAWLPFHFKQHGEWAPASAGMWFDPLTDNVWFAPRAAGKDTHDFGDGYGAVRIGRSAAGRLLDGIEHNGFPA